MTLKTVPSTDPLEKPAVKVFRFTPMMSGFISIQRSDLEMHVHATSEQTYLGPATCHRISQIGPQCKVWTGSMLYGLGDTRWVSILNGHFLIKTQRHVNAGLDANTHTLLLACVHHFTVMWTDLWPWGQMIVLNSITVREQPALHFHYSGTVTQGWSSSTTNAPAALDTGGNVLHAILAMTSCYSDYVIVRVADEEWLVCQASESVSWKLGVLTIPKY